MKYSIADFRSHLSEILRRVEAGESVEIMRYGTTVARVIPASPARTLPLFGALEGKIWIADDFDAPLADLEAALAAPVDPA